MPVSGLFDQDITIIPQVLVVTYADLMFYSLLFAVLIGTLISVGVMLSKNASHSIGSMRSKTSGVPHVPSGGRFNGPAVHGRW